VLINLLHRGACGCEPNTGDGAGILLQVPDKFLRKQCGRLGIPLPGPKDYGVGCVFLPRDAGQREKVQGLVATIVGRKASVCWAGATSPPTTPAGRQPSTSSRPSSRCSSAAARRATPPFRAQALRRPQAHRAPVEAMDFSEKRLTYIPSLSSNTLIYKGMLSADQIESMYPDLLDPDMESALALVHQRFSTNTFPSWPLAHPYRYVAHNGEINTLRGNIN